MACEFLWSVRHSVSRRIALAAIKGGAGHRNLPRNKARVINGEGVTDRHVGLARTEIKHLFARNKLKPHVWIGLVEFIEDGGEARAEGYADGRNADGRGCATCSSVHGRLECKNGGFDGFGLRQKRKRVFGRS